MNFPKLRGILVEKNISYRELSKHLNISLATLVNKMAGRTQFTLKEITDIKKLLDLDSDKMDDIFFN